LQCTSDLKPRRCICAPFHNPAKVSKNTLFIWDTDIQKFYEQTKDHQRDLYTWDVTLSIKEHVVHLGYYIKYQRTHCSLGILEFRIYEQTKDHQRDCENKSFEFLAKTRALNNLNSDKPSSFQLFRKSDFHFNN
jgi:hypothetical protein